MVWKMIKNLPTFHLFINDSGTTMQIDQSSLNAIFITFLTENEGILFHNLCKEKDTQNSVTFLFDDRLKDHVCISLNSSHIYDFMRVLLKLDSGIKDILPDLSKILKLSATLDIDLEQLKLLSKEEATTLVKEVQSNGSYDLIWELFNLYENDSLPQENSDHPEAPFSPQNKYGVSLEELYNLVNSISTTNPHYEKAQTKATHLLMQIDPPESSEEQYKLLELQFQHAIKGSEQQLTDLLFAELCGLKLGDKHTKNIKLDVETLCALAKTVRELKLGSEKTVTHSHKFF